MNILTSFLPITLVAALLLPNSKLETSPSELNNGLVAHYSFNTCAAPDLTDGGSDGEIFGQPNCLCGVEGNALFFDGLDDHVQFPGAVNRVFGTTDFTVSFYVKPSKYSVFRQSLLSKRMTCDDYTHFDLQLDVNYRMVQTDVYESPDKFFRDLSPETPDTDWFHFALVRQGIWAYTFINGMLIKADRKCSGVDIENEALLSFANSPCLNGGRMVRFKGGLDELRVYDRALSEEEIAELYALHPVEMAEADCVTFFEGENTQGEYLCVQNNLENPIY